MAISLRPKGADDLGLRRALSGRLLPLLVAAMVLLASLAGAGGIAAASLAAHWRGGAGRSLTIQVPDPSSPVGGVPRADVVAHLLGPGARRIPDLELSGLLRPWLGEDQQNFAMALPAVFTMQGALSDGAEALLERTVPGTLVGRDSVWQDRLAALAGSLQACADLALLIVAFVAAAVIGISIRAGLSARREAIEIVHGLGATDGTIAFRFAARITVLVLAGAILGVAIATPMLLGLAWVTAPFRPGATLSPTSLRADQLLASLPSMMWVLLASLPPLAAIIGWLTAQLTVRAWLGRLP